MDGLTLLAKIESAYETTTLLNIFKSINTSIPLDYNRLQTVELKSLKKQLILYVFVVFAVDPYTWTKEYMLFVLIRFYTSALYDNILKFCIDTYGIDKDYTKTNMSKGLSILNNSRNMYKVDNIRVPLFTPA